MSSVWLENNALYLFLMVLKTGRKYEATVWEMSYQYFNVWNACERGHVLEAHEWILKLFNTFFLVIFGVN